MTLMMSNEDCRGQPSSAMLALMCKCGSNCLAPILLLGRITRLCRPGKGHEYLKQQRYMLKIASEDLAKYGYVTNSSVTAVAL
jgi:hypothetical protein